MYRRFKLSGSFFLQAEEIAQQGGTAVAAQCDVRNESAQQGVFDAHLRRHNRLDVAVLNAGIFEKGWVASSSNLMLLHGSQHPPHVMLPFKLLDGKGVLAGDFVESQGNSWLATLDINLRGALIGARLAAQAMIKQGTKGEPDCSCSVDIIGERRCTPCLEEVSAQDEGFS
jgi:NAD(P)-dependent dehydrogenase (short-subunit alcohol dehydrogenase family)